MSFFYSHSGQPLIDALMAGDGDTAASLFDDQFGDLEQHLAQQQFATFTGTLDGAGAATVAHGLDLTNSTVLMAQAWYDNAGTITPIADPTIDATNINLTGGGASAAYRVTLVVAEGLNSF